MASLWRVRWLLLLTLFALPLTFFPWAYMAFELPKTIFLYTASILILYLLLSSGYQIKHLTKTHLLYLIFLAWLIITAILGLSLPTSFWGSYFRMQGMLTWAVLSLLFFSSASIFSDNHFRKHACFAILTGSTVSAVLAIIQFIYLWFFGNTAQLLYSNRVISTFGQPNFLGAYLVMSLPFAWYLYCQVKPRWKIPVGLLMIVIVLGIFSTLSRSAYLGLAVLMILWGIYHYRLLLAGVVFAILLFALLANLFPNLVYQEWYRWQTALANKWTAENRLVIAQKSLQLIAQKPVIGYGLENFYRAFPTVVNIKDYGLKDLVVDSSHNLFLDLTIQTGLVGLSLFLIFLTSAFKSAYQQLKLADSNTKDLIKTALATILVFLIIHQFSVVSIGPLVLFWLSLGLLTPSVVKQYKLSQITKYIINFLGICLVIITFGFIIQTLRADALFRQASTYEVADINKAITLDNEAIKLAPWVEFYQLRKGFLLKQLGL